MNPNQPISAYGWINAAPNVRIPGLGLDLKDWPRKFLNPIDLSLTEGDSYAPGAEAAGAKFGAGASSGGGGGGSGGKGGGEGPLGPNPITGRTPGSAPVASGTPGTLTRSQAEQLQQAGPVGSSGYEAALGTMGPVGFSGQSLGTHDIPTVTGATEQQYAGQINQAPPSSPTLSAQTLAHIQAGQQGENVANMTAAASTAKPGAVSSGGGLLGAIGAALGGFNQALGNLLNLTPPVSAQQYTTTSTSGTLLTSQSQSPTTTPTPTTTTQYTTTSTSGQTLPTQTQTSTTTQPTQTTQPSVSGLPSGSTATFGYNASTGQYTVTIRLANGQSYTQSLGSDEAIANANYQSALQNAGYANQQGMLSSWGQASPQYGASTPFTGGPGNPYQAGGIPGGVPEYSGGGATLQYVGNGQYAYVRSPVEQLTPGQWYQGGTAVPINPWPRGVVTMR